MDLKALGELIVKSFENFSFEIDEVTEDNLELYSSGLIAEGYYEDELCFRVSIIKPGMVGVYVLFDRIEYNEETLKLVNEFNDNIAVMKATIIQLEGEYNLELQGYNLLADDEEDVINTIDYFITLLFDEYVREYLTKLTDLTY